MVTSELDKSGESNPLSFATSVAGSVISGLSDTTEMARGLIGDPRGDIGLSGRVVSELNSCWRMGGFSDEGCSAWYSCMAFWYSASSLS